MSAIGTDLWPDFNITVPPRGVRQILQEAGAGIKEKTNGLIDFEVRVYGDRENAVVFDCYLTVRRLNYSMLLFRAQPTTKGFPVTVIWDGANFSIRHPEPARNEQELLTQLRTIFTSPEVKEIVTNLVSLAA